MTSESLPAVSTIYLRTHTYIIYHLAAWSCAFYHLLYFCATMTTAAAEQEEQEQEQVGVGAPSDDKPTHLEPSELGTKE